MALLAFLCALTPITLSSLVAAPLYTSPGNGITVTPAFLVTQGAATSLGGASYQLTSSLQIASADTLQLPAGTTLLPGAAAVAITVLGRLDAQGTTASPITIGSTSSTSWNGLVLNITSRSSAISSLALRNISGIGLRITVTDTTLGSTFQEITLADIQGTALELNSLPAKASFAFRGLAISNAGVGVRAKDCGNLLFESVAITSLNASGATRCGIWIERAGASTRIAGGTFSGPALLVGERLGGSSGADSLVIAGCTFTGSSTETAIELARSARVSIVGATFSGYGTAVAAHSCAGLSLSQSTFSGCGTAVRLVDLPSWAQADSSSESGSAWLELNNTGSGPGNWQSDATGNLVAAAPRGFAFPFQGITYDSVAVFADGHTRLVRSTSEYAALSPGIYEGKSSIMTNGTAPALYGFADDLEPSGDTTIMDGYGVRFFRPGDTDVNGALATETVTVVEWYAAHSDDPATLRNRVAIHLFPDGRIRWMNLALPYVHTRHGFYAGARTETGRMEITAHVNPTETSTVYAFTPSTTRISGTRIDTCVLSGNMTAIQADTAIRLHVTGSTITGNATGITLGGGMESVTIATTNLVSNTTADLAVTATSGAVTISGSYMGSAPIISGNTGLVTTSSPSASPIGITNVTARIVENSGCALVRSGCLDATALTVCRFLRDELLDLSPLRILVEFYYSL